MSLIRTLFKDRSLWYKLTLLSVLPVVNDWSPDNDFYAGTAPIAIQDQQYATLHIGFSFSNVHRQMVSVEKRIWLIKFANPRAVAMSGEASEDFIGNPFTDYLHPDEQEKVQRFYRQRMAQNHPVSIYETILMRKDGELIYAEVNGNLTTYMQRPADLVIIRDITERKLAQEALKEAYDQLEVKVAERTAELAIAKERAEQADRLKSAFLAAMSHELRTPLNSIIGFTGIILQEMVGPLNDEQKKQLTMVKESSHHLLSLINDILDISKIESGQLAVASEPFDLRAVIDRVIKTVTPMARQKGLKIDARVDPQVTMIVSDRRRIEQILLNLINNAVKFTPDGRVTLECETKGSRN